MPARRAILGAGFGIGGARMRGGSFSAAAFAFAVAALAWHFASPWWTLRDLQAAAAARDAERIARHVDLPALRASLKSELAAALVAEAAAGRRPPDDPPDDPGDDPGAAPGAASGLAMVGPLVDGLVDGLVSPAGLRLIFAAEGAGETPAGGLGGAGARIERDGLSAFRVIPEGGGARDNTPENAAAGAQARLRTGALVFRRQGYAWKLVAVDLPETRLAAR